MDMHVRKISADELKNAKILNNDRIQSRLIQRFQGIKKFFPDLTVLKQCIYCEIQLPAMNVRCPDRTDQFFLCKILRVSSCPEIRSAYINCICTGSDRSLESLIGTCR